MQGNKRFSLRMSILSIFVLLVACLVSTLAWYNHEKSTQVAKVIAAELLDKVNQVVIGSARLGMAPVRTLGHTLPRLRELAVKPAGYRHPLLDTFLLSLDAHRQIRSMYVGWDDGDYYQVLLIPRKGVAIGGFVPPDNAVFAVQVIRHGRAGRKEAWWYLDQQGAPVGRRDNDSPGYDPRARPWYKAALASDELINTDPYVYASYKVLGVTRAKRFDAVVPGVFGIDITLDTVSEFLAGEQTGSVSLVFLFGEDGTVSGYPDRAKAVREVEKDGAMTLVPARVDELGDPLAAAVYRRFKEDPSAKDGPFIFELDGAEYLARLTPMDRSNQAEYAAVVAALKGFTGPLDVVRANSLLFSLALLAASLPVIMYIASRISGPIRTLTKVSDDLREFRLDSPVPERSFITEIAALSDSMRLMQYALGVFGRYVPRALVKRLIQTNEVPRLGGDRRELTLLFTDVANFTSLSEGLDPEVLMLKASEYFEEMSQAILGLDGTIDKFIGDAVMAFWNAPVRRDDHAALACAAALRCAAASNALNARWGEAGEAVMFTRFGLHLGEAVVGNVGSSDRMNYTAIGAVVNTASRLEGMNKHYGTQILASAAVRGAAPDFLFRSVDQVVPKGGFAPLDIYQLLGARPGFADCPDVCVDASLEARCARWEEAVGLYRGRRWDEALGAFEALAAEDPSDALAAYYVERVKDLLAHDPGPDWDGVLRFETK